MYDPPPHHPGHFVHVSHPFPRHPAAWCPRQRKRFQDGRELREVKASKAFIWPKDGRNNTSWGRFKDILHNKGPDIFLTINADERDAMRNRPSKARWTGYSNRFQGPAALNSKKHAPWIHSSGLGGRIPGLEYDFRTRHYGVPNWASWRDAQWQPSPLKNKRNLYPEAYADVHGRWFQDPHYMPRPWGPVDNERGRGHPWFNLGPMSK
jgi:hypothetical protein